MMETEPRIPLREAKEQVALVCRRLGLLHMAFAEVLVRELGESEGTRLLAQAVKEYSQRIGQAKKERALQEGLDLGSESFLQMSDLPRFGMHERVEEVEVDGEKRIRAHGCVMGNVWREHGKDALGRYYCYVDPASSMAFDPSLKLVHTRALPDGDPYCELVMRPTTERDRKRFMEKDTDWAAIEADKERKP